MGEKNFFGDNSLQTHRFSGKRINWLVSEGDDS